MIVKVDKSFAKDIVHIKDQRLRKRIADCIDQVRSSDSLTEIGSIKKIMQASRKIRRVDTKIIIYKGRMELINIELLESKDEFQINPVIVPFLNEERHILILH